MKMILKRTAALIVGLMFGVGAWAGLETVTHISDLNSSWPLGSDLASTSDDHIRNIKVALKTDFPNINAAVTATPAALNYTTTTLNNTALLNASNTFSVASSTQTMNSTTATNPSLMFFNLNSVNKIRFGTEGTAGGTITGSAQGDGILYSSGGSLLVSTTAGNLNFKVDGAGAGTIQGASGSFTVNSTTSTNAALHLFNLAGVNKGRFGMEGTSGATITGSTANDLLAYTAGGAFIVSTNSGGAVGFKIAGSNGAVSAAGPTAAALVDMTPDTGTFTATMTGGTTSPTCTARWTRVGNLIMLELCSATATSNANTFTYTGLPAAAQPTVGQNVPMAIALDNGAAAPLITAQLAAGSGTITFFKSASATGWTNVGSKGLSVVNTISYLLN